MLLREVKKYVAIGTPHVKLTKIDVISYIYCDNRLNNV